MFLSMDKIELPEILTNDLCFYEILEIDLFDHLTVCKQINDA